MKYIENSLVFIFLYIPPLIFFLNYSIKRGINKFLLTIISIVYLLLSVGTQNLLPFIIVILSIRYLRKDANFESNGIRSINEEIHDFYRFNFDIRKFNIFRAFKYAVETYGVTIILGIITTIILNYFNINLKEQEIVTDLMNIPIIKFIYMIPIMIIFAPVVEEFTFRWLLFEKLFKPKIGMYSSAILSSLIFSMVHFNLRSMPVMIVIGLINCYLIEKKGYWYAVFNHCFFNSINILLMLQQKIS